MQVVVNGHERELPSGATVEALVAVLGAPETGRGVAVAVEGVVVPHSEWSKVELLPEARIEVLTAVQGG